MIGMLTGTCLVTGAGEAIIDVGGVGYLVQCGAKTLSRLAIGELACLHIETHVREQAITLYGFDSEEARAWFVRLQSVQGVGPKAALSMLDILSPGEILSAASLGDKSAFARASGVGPKLAARIATELSGKAPPTGRGFVPLTPHGGDTARMGAMSGAGAGAGAGEGADADGASDMRLRSDATSALVNLGISESDALRAVANAMQDFSDRPDLDDLIRRSLKEMSRS